MVIETAPTLASIAKMEISITGIAGFSASFRYASSTSAKADITVKTVFDGKQSGQQAFMKLIQRQYRISGADMQNAYIDKSARQTHE